MDCHNIKVYLKPFNFVYETLNSNMFCIIKNKKIDEIDQIEVYDYKLLFIVTNTSIRVDLYSRELNDINALKLLFIRINHHINNLTNKDTIALILQKGYRYNFVTNIIKCIEMY
jgi:hypothetical protein